MSGRLQDAFRRLARTLRTRALGLARPAAAASLAAAALCAPPALSATTNPSRMDIDVSYQGIAGIKDLVVTPGVSTGMLQLAWTEPGRVGTTGPHLYDVRVSTLGQINSQADFLAAKPLSLFTVDVPPLPGVGGGGVAVVFTGLQNGVAHYFAVVEKDALGATGVWSRTSGWNQGNHAAPPGLFVSTNTPMEPMGIETAPAPNSVTFTWQPVTRFHDGVPFVDPANPTPAELVGYSVFRSLLPCSTDFVLVSSVPYTTRTITDNTGGLNYYYRLYSYNLLDKSSTSATFSSLGDRSFFADDCKTVMTVDSSLASMLNGATNGLGGDVRIVAQRRPQDVTGATFQSMEWKAMLNGVTEMKGFTLPRPIRMALHFDMAGGAPVPSTAPVGPLSAPPASGRVAAASAKDLGAYWFNGADFKKMYGKVDETAQTVSVDSPNLGIYQVRALARADGAVFDVSNVSKKVITPNGDGLNDVVIFTYDPGPRNAQVTGRIYDVNGQFVAGMAPGLVPNTLTWDGRSGGRAVSSGVYLYKIEGDGKTFTGTVVVAR